MLFESQNYHFSIFSYTCFQVSQITGSLGVRLTKDRKLQQAWAACSSLGKETFKEDLALGPWGKNDPQAKHVRLWHHANNCTPLALVAWSSQVGSQCNLAQTFANPQRTKTGHVSSSVIKCRPRSHSCNHQRQKLGLLPRSLQPVHCRAAKWPSPITVLKCHKRTLPTIRTEPVNERKDWVGSIANMSSICFLNVLPLDVSPATSGWSESSHLRLKIDSKGFNKMSLEDCAMLQSANSSKPCLVPAHLENGSYTNRSVESWNMKRSHHDQNNCVGINDASRPLQRKRQRDNLGGGYWIIAGEHIEDIVNVLITYIILQFSRFGVVAQTKQTHSVLQ